MSRDFWDDLFTTLATECGYTFEQIRRMTLHDVGRLYRGWQRSPPTGILIMVIARALGVEFKSPEPKKYMTDADARRMLAMTAGRIEGLGQQR